jgi:uncharacterized protein YdaU (DUF1376 family)
MGEKDKAEGAAPGPPRQAPDRRSQSSHPASFPLYWRDWLSDPRLRAMSRDERGGFLDVLCFTQGTKTVGIYTEEECRVWAGYSWEAWQLVREKFLAVHTVRRDGLWLQKRARRERAAQKIRYKRARKAGKKGARNRWDPKVLNGPPIAQAIAQRCPSPDPDPVSIQQAKPSTESPTRSEATVPGELAVASELAGALFTRLAGTLSKASA